MVLVLFFLTCELSCGMRYLILSVPMSLLVLKENPGPHFVQRLFFLMNISRGYFAQFHVTQNAQKVDRNSAITTYLKLLNNIKEIQQKKRKAWMDTNGQD